VADNSCFRWDLVSTSSKSIWLAGWLGGRHQLFSLGSAGVKIINAACPAKVYGWLGGWVADNSCFRWDPSFHIQQKYMAGWVAGWQTSAVFAGI